MFIELEIIHFNDVYNIEEHKDSTDIKAGSSRFVTALDQYNSKDKLVLFSGDLFFPSHLSNHYNGCQMIKPFNRMNVDISCLGNHELDKGQIVAKELIEQTNCEWVISNLHVQDGEGEKVMLDLKPYQVIHH